MQLNWLAAFLIQRPRARDAAKINKLQERASAVHGLVDLLLFKASVLSRLLPATSHRTSPTHVQGSSCLATRQRRNPPHAQLA